MRVFDLAVYPHGCRCSNCKEEFQIGEGMIDYWLSAEVSTPVCWQCEGVRLPDMHGNPVFKADGTVEIRTPGVAVGGDA